ncbi:hypothetical protein HPB52_014193 [Rhipicephalus sanguineus]|uniref:Uncharacterized protein n=1 Tax=Rhipicephalus sanguineus TaxID=34632 RepID=A0A9D4QBH0_RHISA|nr:hypothetical protein HPB52_014193 [Rhipicephalus sanguineus]
MTAFCAFPITSWAPYWSYSNGSSGRHWRTQCRRLRNLVNGAQWLRCARFTLQDTPAVFTSLMVPPITDIIVELDVRFYVTAKQEQLVKAISQCTNLVVLRCVHSRILSMSVVLLLWKKLRRLECLHWSVSEVKAVSVKASDFTAENSEDSARCDCSSCRRN